MDTIEQSENKGRAHFQDDMGKWFIIKFSEDEHSREDFWMTARTDTGRTYIGDVKNYENKENPRPYDKFNRNGRDGGYQIDYEKIDYLVKEGDRQGRIPILYARFSDYTIVWDLRDIPYQERARMKDTNKFGYAYGEKERSIQTYLYKREAKWVITTT